jgi:hypothetical protein
MKKLYIFLAYLTVQIFVAENIYATTIYVDASKSAGLNNGSSWANAYTSFQSALNAAVSGDQIWTAKGTYKPSSAYDLTNTSRYYHFRMINGVAIYGGFVGIETAINQRTDFGVGGANETILSGDLNGDDVVTGAGASLVFANNGENCYHVFYHPAAIALNNTAILDGFTLKGGNSNGGSYYNGGGGIFNEMSSPTLINLSITDNSASQVGGGICNSSCSPSLTNLSITKNSSGYSGGGLYNHLSSPELTNILILNNYAAEYGGGLSNDNYSSPNIINTKISNNYGYYGGGMYNVYFCSPNLINVIITMNSANQGGGGAYNYSSSSPSFNNTTISKNTASYGGGFFNNSLSSPTLNNCILWGNTAGDGNQVFINTPSTTTLNYSCYSNGPGDLYGAGTFVTTNNNITTNPKFVNSTDGDYRLVGYSPCINNGNNSYNTQPTDIRGEARIQNTTIDMGAYEWTSATDPTGLIIYVKHDATGSNNGTSWTNAYTSFQSALNAAVNGDQIWTAKGTYKPSYAYDLTNTSRYYHFRMKNGVAIYGGFVGTETDVSQRSDFSLGGANETILSGDLAGNDVITGSGANLTFNNNGENCYYIFYHPRALDLDSTAILDGFILKGANANGSGGGICNYSASPNLSNLYITNCYAGYGGGMYNDSSFSVMKNISFLRNKAICGGGIYNSYSSLKMTNTIISGNSVSVDGGGLYNYYSQTIVTNCTISNNSSFYYAGGVLNYHSPTAFSNVLISNNSASNNNHNSIGGGMVNYDSKSILINVSVVKNHADYFGGGIYNNASGTSFLYNCIIWGNSAGSGNQLYLSDTATLNYSCYSNGANDVAGANFLLATNNNLTVDPRFVNESGGDFRLFGISPCVDSGNNSYNSEVFDIRGAGFGRKLSKIDGSPGTIDMGAYEYKFGYDSAYPCINPTSGGTISADQSICSGETPELLANITDAGGYSGVLEYQWQQSTTSASTGFVDISGTNSNTYQPVALNDTTWFRRLARVDCMIDWSGTVISNAVKMTINYSNTGDTTATACDSFSWNGNTYTSSASPTKVLTNKTGCDSTVTLHLTINYSNTGDTTATACDSFSWNGNTYTSSASPTKVLTNKTGCDSTVTLHLTINYSNTGDTTVTACNSFNWNGINYTSSATPTKVLTNKAGCDSIVTLHLTVNYSNTGDTTVTACNSFFWNGNTYTSSATPTKVLTNKAGCDSTVTLHLTVNYSNTGDTTVTACNSFNWNGINYTSSATPTKVLTNKAGCDSIVTLHLTVNYSNTGDTTVTACNSFFWNGNTYTSSATPTKVLTNKAGCDSAVTLLLTVNYSNTGDTTVTTCNSFNWNGNTYTSSVTPTKVLTNKAGCDSTVTLHLTVNYSNTGDTTVTACNSFFWNGNTYTSSATPTKVLTNKAGCDSTVTLHLTIASVDVGVTLSGLTITADSVADGYQWVNCDNGYAHINGQVSQSYTATANGNFAVVITQGLCSDTSACSQITTVGIGTVSKDGFAIYPNPSNGKFTLVLDESADIVIFNALGSEIYKASLEKGKQILTLNMTNGVYLLKVGNGNINRTTKIVIQK